MGSANRLEQSLRELDQAIAAQPTLLAPRLERAQLLARLGDVDLAKRTYLEILSIDPTHRLALNNLATLLYRTGYTSAARTAYRQAVAHHPDDVVAHTNLANLLYYTNQLDEALTHYRTALMLEPDHRQTHQGLALLHGKRGEEDAAGRHRDLAYRSRPAEIFPWAGDDAPVPLLLLVSALDGTLPWQRLVDDRVFQATTLTVEYVAPDAPVPAHALLFNAIGDADLCHAALVAASGLIARSPAPVLNHPDAVLRTGRVENAQRMSGIPGVIAPRICAIPREALTAPGVCTDLAARGLAFPLLVRSTGFQTGHHFEQVHDPSELTATVERLPGRELLAIEHLDARGPDGMVRKYRVMCIGGRLYPLHLAVSSTWKVHYFSSAMKGQAAFQAEERAFLADMPGVLGSRALAALECIRDRLGLDYGGIDVGRRADGELLFFEANATMRIDPPGIDRQWDYRRPAITAALDAARALLRTRALPWDSAQQIRDQAPPNEIVQSKRALHEKAPHDGR
jgi:hypothetical protein